MTGGGDIRFDLAEDLPSGRLAIQASAGTGKTHALAALATRFIAEGGISASELLIVTFTRAATDELRAKVREQLVKAADHLGGGPPSPTDDELLRHLGSTDQRQRLDRLTRAITEFDAATITTIHGFATQVRSALGTSAGIDPDARLVDDAGDLIAETCSDVLAAAAMDGNSADDLPGLGGLIEATRLAVGRPHLALAPSPDQPGANAGQRLLGRLTAESIRAMSDRRRRSGTLGFDDVLIELQAALAGAGSAGVVETLRSRFKVALIDEFQDTDSVQWDIFSRVFGDRHAGTTLVLVGDPKQAIYGFRGADVEAYLGAVAGHTRAERRSLAVNWRSDGAVLSSLGALFERATFGDPGIPFVPVEPAEPNRHRRLLDGRGDPIPAVSVRLAIGPGIARNQNATQISTDAAAMAIDHDLAAGIRELLADGRIPEAGEEGPHRPVRPSDIAVLVSTNAQTLAVQVALVDQGVPAVVANSGNVLESPAADQLRYLLNAMDRPSDTRRARTFAMSWFIGWDARQLVAASDDDLAELQDHLRTWSEMLADHPVAEVLAQVWSARGLVARVLGGNDGDRNLTDLDHLAELLHGSTPTGLSSVGGLLAVLDAEPEKGADTDVDGNVAARRVESDADAVQILTIWKAKGLQFPIVCLPSLWRNPTRDPVIYTDPDTGVRTLDLTKGQPWPDKRSAEERKREAAATSLGEQLRLLYVAMTRTKHRVIVWWANAQNSNKTALAHLLFARADGAIDPESYGAPKVTIPPDGDIEAALQTVAERAGGSMAIASIDTPTGTAGRWIDPHVAPSLQALEVARFDIDLDRSAQRWSFSAITQRASVPSFDPYDPSLSDGGSGDEQWTGDGDVEPGEGGELQGSGTPRAVQGMTDEPGALAWLPAGAAFGTLVHSVLEDVDFTARDVEESLAKGVDGQLAWRSLDLTPIAGTADTPATGRGLLIDGLRAAILTPLGSQWGDMRLADIAPADRLNEVTFDLRLGGAGRHAQVRDIGRLGDSHLASSDPLRPWAAGLAGGSIDLELAGHLTGSIDLVMRIRGDGGREQFVVADYKTNKLNPRRQAPSSDDYRPERMAEAMVDHDYPLQALLYSVALHRYLRWRLPRYEPSSHLGGVAYLFLRGMTGPRVARTDGRPHGVFGWAVPPALVVELSDLLDGRLVLGGAS